MQSKIKAYCVFENAHLSEWVGFTSKLKNQQNIIRIGSERVASQNTGGSKKHCPPFLILLKVIHRHRFR